MREALDAAAVRQWCASGLAVLRRHQGEIDRLNVYPVADADTGTNLVLTLAAGQRTLTRETRPDEAGARTAHGQVLRQFARGALLGAHGNSGMIVSQLLRGLADALDDVPTVRGRALAAALTSATKSAYSAVATPVEGTMLSVASAAATAAERADSDDLGAVVRAAVTAAADALARTPGQLPALAAAGVVDAGGYGLCLLLGALFTVVTGDPAPVGVDQPAATPRTVPTRCADPVGPMPARRADPADPTGCRYEVQYLLDVDDATVEGLRAVLAGLGDSLVIVGDEKRTGGLPTWHVHVHVNDVGAVIEAGIAVGRPYRIAVTRLDDLAGPAADRRATVAVAAGDGLARIFAAEGATVVAGAPSADELLDAIRSTGATRIVVLPNDGDAQVAANTAALWAQPLGVQVSVVPTRSPVQALAALAVRDPARRFDDDVIAMAEAAGACRRAEVRRADRQALTVVGPCLPGDVLALVEGEVNLVGADLTGTCRTLLDRMLSGGGELLTLLLGADAPADLGEILGAHVARRWPFVEVHIHCGGQPDQPLLVGVE